MRIRSTPSPRPGTIALVLVAAVAAAGALAFPQRSLADPPVFRSIPKDMLVVADSSEGTYVDYPDPVASDGDDGAYADCEPQSGDFFPVGATTVTCTAYDELTDDQSQASFQVRVLAAPQEQASSGPLRALLYYTKTTDAYGLIVFKNVRLTLIRSGQVVYSAAVPSYPGHSRLPAYPAGWGEQRAMFVRDLDGDGEPEVRLDLFWGGAHCCFWSDVYRYDGGSYRLVHHFWGDASYRLNDLDGDGRPEFLSGDYRFSYSFAAFAFSYFPLQVWSYDGGRFIDVTRRYPARIRSDAARDWRSYLRLRRQHYETEGAAAAWAADEYLLGHRGLVWRRLTPLARAGKLQGNYPPRLFLRKLRLFLNRNGYR